MSYTPTYSRLGANLSAVSNDAEQLALFRAIYMAEVMTAFETASVMNGRHMIRNITAGKSAKFPIVGKMQARYWKPSVGAILGSNQGTQTEKTINVDGLCISDVMIYEYDEAMSAYDLRGPYTQAQGRSLARAFDRQVIQAGILGARQATDLLGTATDNVFYHSAAATDGETLGKLLYDVAVAMDEQDVPEDGRFFLTRPAIYALLAQTARVLDKNLGGKGSYADGTVVNIAGITILKSNNVPNTNITEAALEAAPSGTAPTGTSDQIADSARNTYHGDFSTTVGLVFTPDALATVKLMDMRLEQEYMISYQGTLSVAKMAVGHDWLRPECLAEVATTNTTP